MYADKDKAQAHADYAALRRLKEQQSEILADAAIEAMKKRGSHFGSGFREKLMDLIYFAV